MSVTTLYNKTNRIKFTSISEKLPVPKWAKVAQGRAHSALITYVVDHYVDTKRYRKKVTDAINRLTYCVVDGQVPSLDWSVKDPFVNMPDIPEELIQEKLSYLYLLPEYIDWDVEPVSSLDTDEVFSKVNAANMQSDVELPVPEETPKKPVDVVPEVKPVTKPVVKPAEPVQKDIPTSLTTKEDLYIQPPRYPQFDYSNPWLKVTDKNDLLVIYPTIPEIPTKQNEISATTDVSKMTDADLMRLFPDSRIRTRRPSMYEPVDGLEYDDIFGNIIPVQGFTSEQIRENILKYPHIYKLQRVVDGEVISFYDDIEIDGELLSIASVWESLPESQYIPQQSDFIKEYVVRRYLLERDAGVEHKYPMYGTLDPFLTLFMPPQDYAEFGYSNPIALAKQCVNSRVSFKISRNPILRRLHIV